MRDDDGQQGPPEPTASSNGARLAVDVTLVAAISILLAVAALVGVMRVGALSPATYQAALVDVDAYERAYTEVLADPELAAVTDPLLGDLVHPRLPAADVRALTTNLVRWSVPPATLQRSTERVIDVVLGYVRGDIDDLRAEVDVTSVVDRIPDVTAIGVRSWIARLPELAIPADRFAEAIDGFGADLAAGRIPESVPAIGGGEYDPRVIADAVIAALGLDIDPEIERRIRAAAEIDARAALIEASSTWISGHAVSVADRVVAAAPDRSRRVELRDAASDRAATSAAAVVDVLDRARDAASVLRPATAIVALALAALAAVALVVRGRIDRTRAASLVAAGVAGAGVLTVVGWLAVARMVGGPITAGVDAAEERPLPQALTALLLDLEASVGDDLRGLSMRFGVYLLAAAAVILVVARGLPRLPTIPPRAIPVALGVAGIAVVAAGIVTLLTAESDAPRRCNGHVELCDRPYDDVVQAATHNSMSSPDVVPVWPEHDGDIRSQLDAGVRALLIDTHYWTPIRSVQALLDVHPELSNASAERLLDAVADRTEGRPGTFLCHLHCVFGAVPFGEALETIHEFLIEHPHDVVTLIIQDAITPADTEDAFEHAGLVPFLYVHDGAAGWPTLGTMIDRDERLVVLAEEAGPPPAWYHQGFELMQETPFLFRSSDNMSCEPNRGDPDATLFQMNHWIQRIAPDRVDSVIINDHDFLVERALRCRDERGLLPNFLAVNFYNIGDLMQAVDTLNGVSNARRAHHDDPGGS